MKRRKRILSKVSVNRVIGALIIGAIVFSLTTPVLGNVEGFVTTRDKKKNITTSISQYDITGDSGSGWRSDYSFSNDDLAEAIWPDSVSDSDGNVYVVVSGKVSSTDNYGIYVFKLPADGGEGDWNLIYSHDPGSHDYRHPTIDIGKSGSGSNALGIAYWDNGYSDGDIKTDFIDLSGGGIATNLNVDITSEQETHPDIEFFENPNDPAQVWWGVTFTRDYTGSGGGYDIVYYTLDFATYSWDDEGYVFGGGAGDSNLYDWPTIVQNTGGQYEVVIMCHIGTEIISKRWNANDGTYGSKIWITNAGNDVLFVQATSSSDTIVVTYEQKFSDGNWDVYSSRSTDDGASWSTPQAIQQTTDMECWPTVGYNGVFRLYFMQYPSGSSLDATVRYYYSSDGSSWSGGDVISDVGGESDGGYRPSVSFQERGGLSSPLVTFGDYRDGDIQGFMTTNGAHYTINTDPSGLDYSFDGVTHSSEITRSKASETTHTLETWNQGDYRFDYWSDGSDNHYSTTWDITYGTSDKTYTAYFELNTAPDAPTNPSPSDGAASVSTSPTLSVDVSDPNGDTMDVSFYDASDDSLINTDTGVSSGGTASVTWSSLSYETTYDWYAVADDSTDTTSSSTWSFTTAGPPDAPTNPSPSDGATGVSTSPTLSVDVSDPDGDTMDVSFYDASDDSLIDTDTSVSSGGTASVTWSSLLGGTTYDWYAVADDGTLTTSSITWSFTTNAAPDSISNPSPSDGATGVSTSPTLSVDVSDPDGDTMDVSFYDASDDSLIGTDTSVSSGGTASVSWSGLSYETAYDWYAVADDGTDTTSSSTWSFTTAGPPDVPTNPSPSDGATGISISPTLSVDVSDPDGDTMDVSFYDASDDSLINTDTGVSSGGTASVSWPGLSYETTYNWYAVADDGTDTTSSSTWSFTTESAPYYSVTVSSPSNATESSTGVYTYTFTIENTGDTQDSYDLLSTTSNSGWSVSSQSLLENISAGSSQTVDVEVTIPSSASEGESSDITLTATSQSDPSVSDSGTMTVTYTTEKTYGVSVSAPSDATESSTGTFTYSFTVDNTGNTEETMDVSVSSSDWSADLQSSSVTISSGSSSTIDVDVVIPSSASDGESSDVTLTATSQSDPSVSESGTMTVTYTTEPTYGVSVSAPSDETIESIGSFEFTFTIYNTGNMDDTYILEPDTSNSDLSLSVQSSIYIQDGESKSVTVNVIILEDIEKGVDSDIQLSATSETEESISDSDEMFLSLNVAGGESEDSTDASTDEIADYWWIILLIIIGLIIAIAIATRKSPTENEPSPPPSQGGFEKKAPTSQLRTLEKKEGSTESEDVMASKDWLSQNIGISRTDMNVVSNEGSTTVIEDTSTGDKFKVKLNENNEIEAYEPY